MRLHVYAWSMEDHSLSFQADPLFQACFTRQPDPAARTQHPMPWKTDRVAKGPCHLPGPARISGSLGDRAIGRNLTPRNARNYYSQLRQHKLQSYGKRRVCLHFLNLSGVPGTVDAQQEQPLIAVQVSEQSVGEGTGAEVAVGLG